MTALLAALAGILGLAIGSFLNVVIYRVPRGESLSRPPSACPDCAHPIRWYDNVPVVSWIVLRGRCRDCGEPISIRYPLVELTTGVLFALLTVRFAGPSTGAGISAELWALPAFLYLAAVGVALTMIDLDTHRLPNVIVLPSYPVGAVLLVVASAGTGEWGALLRAAIGAAGLFAFYLLLALVVPKGMGFGDVKLAGVLGLYLGWLGWGALGAGSFAAFLLGGLFAMTLLLARRAGRRSGIPFGPWMLAGAGVGTFFGESIADGYLGLVGLN